MRNFIIIVFILLAISSIGIKNACCKAALINMDSLYIFVGKNDSTILKKCSSTDRVYIYKIMYKDLVEKRNKQKIKRDSIDREFGYESMWGPLQSASFDYLVYKSDTIESITTYKFIDKDTLRLFKNIYNPVFFIEEMDNSLYLINECELIFNE